MSQLSAFHFRLRRLSGIWQALEAAERRSPVNRAPRCRLCELELHQGYGYRPSLVCSNATP